MAKVLVVTSGKGGVGKTTSTAALGVALAKGGKNVVLVDFDVGLRNLDLVMGAERRVVYDLINVVQGDAKLAQALIRDKRLQTLSLLPASQTRDKDALTDEGVAARFVADRHRCRRVQRRSMRPVLTARSISAFTELGTQVPPPGGLSLASSLRCLATCARVGGR